MNKNGYFPEGYDPRNHFGRYVFAFANRVRPATGLSGSWALVPYSFLPIPSIGTKVPKVNVHVSQEYIPCHVKTS